MNKEESDDLFKRLGRLSPKMDYLAHNSDGQTSYGCTYTDFWEKLYQAFKARMEHESASANESESEMGAIDILLYAIAILSLVVFTAEICWRL